MKQEFIETIVGQSDNTEDYSTILKTIFIKWKEIRGEYFKNEFTYQWKKYNKAKRIPNKLKSELWINVNNVNIESLTSLSQEDIDFFFMNFIALSKTLIKEGKEDMIKIFWVEIKKKSKKIRNVDFMSRVAIRSALKQYYSHVDLIKIQKEKGKEFTSWWVEEITKLWLPLPKDVKFSPNPELEIKIRNPHIS